MTKKSIFYVHLLICLIGISGWNSLNAQNLKLHYGLSADLAGNTVVSDESGNGFNGNLLNGAKISSLDGTPVVDLGTTNGYVDMGTNVGSVIASLEDFTISTKIFVPSTTSLTSNGNFVWTFANSNNIGTYAKGCIFFSAKSSRYAISPTNYLNESGIQTGNALAKGAWKTIVYVQKSGFGQLYINGILMVSGDIALNPSKLGATAYNYIGRSCYAGDAYLNNAKLADFRIYDGALSRSQIIELSEITQPVYNPKLLVQYNFDKSSDSTDTYNGTLMNGAALINCSGMPVLNLGKNDGYFNLGNGFGSIISKLDSFTISTDIMIPASTDISGNGNFVWTFANSLDMGTAQNGNMFLCAKNTRYAISKTNYSAESAVNFNKALSKGKWLNLTYTQTKNNGQIFINGALMGEGTVTINPSALGATSFNLLGRSCYAGDNYLKNAKYHKFRVYDGAMGETGVLSLCQDLEALNHYEDSLRVTVAMTELSISNADSVRTQLILPKVVGDGVSVSWSSSNTSVVSAKGEVTRPASGEEAVKVVLTATLTYQNITLTKQIEVTVLPSFSDQDAVKDDLSRLSIGGNIHNLHSAAILPITTLEGSHIDWISQSPDYINNVGRVLKLSPRGSGKKKVILTATISRGEVSESRDFEVQIAEDEGTASYLFAYFTGNDQSQEQIRFSVSNDGYNYTPLNNGSPIISSDTIALKKAVRDPHILRGQDGKTFYMVATDMKSSEGWDSNRGIVMLKSTDLVNWKHATVNFPTKWPLKWANVTRVWAPETIYDPETGKYLVYFSLLTNDGSCPYDKIFYCYANEDFTDLEGEPVYLFDRGSATIDGDIVYNEVDSLYHLFYKNEGQGGICQATAKTLTARSGQPLGSQWGSPSGTLQQTTEAVEGVGVFKLINSDNWVMMYDCYANAHYQFCTSSDLNMFTFVQNNSAINARHGTTIAITDEEANRLLQRFPSSTLTNTPLGARNANIRKSEIDINHSSLVITLPVSYGVDLKNFDPLLFASPGTIVSPTGNQDFSTGPVNYSFTLNGNTKTYQVYVNIEANPVIPDFHADPEIAYSKKTKRFYLYPTTDGFSGWGGYYFDVFSSPDLVNWTNEGTMLDLSTDQVSWATGNAWAPCIEEKKVGENDYKYYFYFSGESNGKKIGVVVANDPAGPFIDSGAALVSDLPSGVSGGQQIDVDVFTDPVSGKSYLYWGNGYMAVAELNDDMISIKEGTTKVLTPSGGTLSTYAYREGTYVFYRNGIYYFMWSVDDTGAANYHVAYGTSSSPTGPITVASQPIVISQDAANKIYGTGHNSILQIPGRDEWYIVYHRINRKYLNNNPGIHREVCIDKLNFNEDGTIQKTTPTRKGIEPISVTNDNPNAIPSIKSGKNGAHGKLHSQQVFNFSGMQVGNDLSKLNHGFYVVRNIYADGTIIAEKFLKKVL